MNVPDDSQKRALDELLVAYLDGELSPEERRQLEERLATDADVRRRLKELEKTWELLDDLNARPTSRQLVQSTLEMVAVAAKEDAEQTLVDASRRRRFGVWAVFGGLLLSLAAGFCITALILPDPNRQLVDDLSILENLDAYRAIGDIAFLQSLRDAGLFSSEGGEAIVETATTVPDSSAERRERIRQMTPGEKQRLATLQERFQTLELGEQERLQQLDQSLRNAPDAERLVAIMHRYVAWLKTLPSFAPAELAGLSAPDRVQWIKKRLKAEQTRDGWKRLSTDDAAKLTAWIHNCLERSEKELQKTLTPPQRVLMANAPPSRQREILLFHWWQRWQASGSAKPPLLTDKDLATLRLELSEKVRKRLENKDANEQWLQVADWLRSIARQRLAKGGFGSFDDDRLAEFFDHLPDAKRDHLLTMPGEEMQRALLRMYWAQMKAGEEFPAIGGGRKHERRPDSSSPHPKKPETTDKQDATKKK
jgi:hypothetical protein